MYIWKYVSSELALDEVVHIAGAAYSFVPNRVLNMNAFLLCFEEIALDFSC